MVRCVSKRSSISFDTPVDVDGLTAPDASARNTEDALCACAGELALALDEERVGEAEPSMLL